MSATKGSAIDAAGDTDSKLEAENLNVNTAKTDSKHPYRHGGKWENVFGGINVASFHAEQRPVAKTFFGQYRVPDISELGVDVSVADVDTSIKSAREAGVSTSADVATTNVYFSVAPTDGATALNGRTVAVLDSDEADVDVQVVVTDDNEISVSSALPVPRSAWESYSGPRTSPFNDPTTFEYYSRDPVPLIESASSSDDALSSNYDLRRERPLVTTYSDQFDASVQATASRSQETCVAFEDSEEYHVNTGPVPDNVEREDLTDRDRDGYSYPQTEPTQGDYSPKLPEAANAKLFEDLSAEQFQLQLDNYMESMQDEGSSLCPTDMSSSNGSNIESSASSSIGENTGYDHLHHEVKRGSRCSEAASPDDDVDDNDDYEDVDLNDVMTDRGPKYVSLPRRGYIHPLLRSYNDLHTKGAWVAKQQAMDGGVDAATRPGDKLAPRQTDQGHGDRADSYQRSGKDSSGKAKKKCDCGRGSGVSVYNRMRRFFRMLLHRKAPLPDSPPV